MQNCSSLSKLILAILSILVSGCSATFGHGQSLDEYEEQLYASNCDFDAIDSMIKNDPLLWTLNGGALARNCKMYQKSIEYFDAAEDIFKNQEEAIALKSFGQSTASVLINNNVNDYQGETYEKILVNVYKGMNFLSLGDFDNARVEFNRVIDRQRRAKEFFENELELAYKKLNEDQYADDYNLNHTLNYLETNAYYSHKPDELYPIFINPFATYMSAIFAYLDKDYSKARDLFRQTAAMLPDNPQIKQDLKLTEQATLRRQHYVWLIYENGLGVSKKSINYRFPTYLFSEDIITSDVNLPYIYERQSSYKYLTIDGHKTSQIANMDNIIQQEFIKKYPIILSEAILNMIAKSMIQYTLATTLENYGGKWLGFFYQITTGAADIRHWRALPKDFQIARINLTGDSIIIKSSNDEIITTIDTLSPEHDAIIYIRSDIKEHNIVHVIQK